MPFGLSPEDKVAKATEEYGQQLRDLYKHECYGSKKKECKLFGQHYKDYVMFQFNHVTPHDMRKTVHGLCALSRVTVGLRELQYNSHISRCSTI